MMRFYIRKGNKDDLPFLRIMLYEAAYWDSTKLRPLIDEGLGRSDLVHLLKDWGRPGDTSVIAESDDGKKIGASWYRFWTQDNHSYGFVDSQTPEISIAVKKDYRRKGIGKALLFALTKEAKSHGIRKLSLSVEYRNFSRLLYRSVGFKKVSDTGGSWTMIIDT